jgi:hypothetical protein
MSFEPNANACLIGPAKHPIIQAGKRMRPERLLALIKHRDLTVPDKRGSALGVRNRVDRFETGKQRLATDLLFRSPVLKSGLGLDHALLHCF